MKKNTQKRGFTIVELVIVIAVIAILATVLVPVFGDVISNAKDSKAMQEAKNAYTQYMVDHAAEGAMPEYMVYDADGRFVALHNGSTVGVYESKEDALIALFDAPDTTENEAEHYIAVQITGSAWYICREDFSDLTYVAFGDSITYGVDGNYEPTSDIPENHGEGKRYMANPYPKLVGEILGIGTVSNEGVSGATLCSGSGKPNMTQNILNFHGKADIISVMLGVNDYALKMPLGNMNSRDNATVYGSLHLIAQHLTENYPDSLVFFMTPFQMHGGTAENSAGYTLPEVAQAVKAVAAQYGIPVLDMYDCGKYELEFNDTSLDYQDGIHPSQQHHINYTAPLIADLL